ncbi:hypothetical protein [Kibdelosporangium aridum]|uniref:hypothetical protein n=1 Tax=Kibdelosporangium aridum TaxID=2030 RepID=UPI00117A828C|nr:hypothetical protein [Kibdelosporangium aridum]
MPIRMAAAEPAPRTPAMRIGGQVLRLKAVYDGSGHPEPHSAASNPPGYAANEPPHLAVTRRG